MTIAGTIRLAFAAAALATAASAGAGELFDQATLDFAAKVDLARWELLPAEQAGRVGILDTLARRQVRGFYGSPRIEGQSATFSLLEVYFNAGAYLDRPVVLLGDRRDSDIRLEEVARRAGISVGGF